MKRKQYSAAFTFKAKVALEAIRGLKTTNEIASEFGAQEYHPSKEKILSIPVMLS